MAISGLAILLEADPESQRTALAALASRPDLVIGPQVGPRVAVTLETPDLDSDRAAVDALRAVPGVLHLDVICVFFPDDPDEADETSDPNRPAAPRSHVTP